MNGSDVRDLIAKADALRDFGDFAGAAAAYQAALDLGAKAGARRQLANMLKDSGAHARAEIEYRRCLAAEPDDADLHLQLGHLYKLWGRSADSAASYREAAKNGSKDAVQELKAIAHREGPPASANISRRELEALIQRALDERLRIAPGIEDRDLLALVLDLKREVAELRAELEKVALGRG